MSRIGRAACATSVAILSMLATSAAVAFQNTPATGPGERPISIDRITRSSVPAAPSVISLKIQPIHRIAKEAHTSGVREQEYTKATRSIDNGLLWLGAHQEPSGLWRLRNTATPTDEPDNPTSVDLAITALAVKAFAQRGLASSHLDKGIAALLNEIDRQGGFHGGEGTALGTYVSATVASALATLDDPRYEDQLEQALTWLKEEQWSDQDGLVPEQDWFGGVGYGNRGRPDLSNTQMMLDALYDAGICPDDPAAQRALVFVSRTQNLKTTNGAQWAQAGSNDGGFIYTPANGGESMGSEYAGEGRYGELLPPDAPRQLRSYGSMTYAGFKSLLHAGLNEEDPRVSAALDWIKANWTFAENPGAGKQGVYYYRHALGRTMQVSGMEQIVTTDGIAHPWRSELIAALIADQNEEGYWINPEPRWLEGEKTLATCYAILALEEALKGSGRLSDPLETPESDSSDE